jgi:GTP pyrophosphokinase
VSTDTDNGGAVPPAQAQAEALRLLEGIPGPAADRGRGLEAILAEIHSDPGLRAASLLFPAVMEGALKQDQISGVLGDSGVELVEELCRLSDFGLPGHWAPDTPLPGPQAETLRKMLLAIVADVRLILVRLADQLYRLKTAMATNQPECGRIAVETREIFAPLANRLGIWHLKWQLEDLAFRALEPQVYQEIATFLDQRRDERESRIREVITLLERLLGEAGISADIQGRPKHIYSIWRKMRRKQVGIDEIFDISAVRVLVDTIPDCYAVLGIVHGRWAYVPGEFDDYITTPKGNFYRSLHTAVMGPRGEPLEIQIRTHEMHEHSELGVAAHWRYKEGGGADPAFDQKINWLRQLIAPADDAPANGTESDQDFVDRVRAEIFEDRVYAFTPAGDVVDLPAGSTPLDFAYHVHTEVGNHCRGARVNGRMVTLTHTLANGDKVEVLTSKASHPSRDWLRPQSGYLVSPRSRSKVRAWFRKQDKVQNIRHGRTLLERELQRLGITHDFDTLAKRFNYASHEQLFLAVGAGDLTMNTVANALEREQAEAQPEDERILHKRRRPKAREGEVTVSGVGDLLTQYARCCRPVPPESIVGYITQGRGVTIHRLDCANLVRLQTRSPERVIPVSWGEPDEEHTYAVAIRVEALDRQGLVRDVTAVLADESIDIIDMSTYTDEAQSTHIIEATVGIPGLEELSRILHRLGSLPNVFSARRKT